MQQLIFISLVLCTGSPSAKRARLGSSEIAQPNSTALNTANDQLADLARVNWDLEGCLAGLENNNIATLDSDSAVFSAQENTSSSSGNTTQTPFESLSVDSTAQNDDLVFDRMFHLLTGSVQPHTAIQPESDIAASHTNLPESVTADPSTMINPDLTSKRSDGKRLHNGKSTGRRKRQKSSISQPSTSTSVNSETSQNSSIKCNSDMTTVSKYYQKFREFIESCKDKALFKNFFNKCLHERYTSQIESNPDLIDFFYDVLNCGKPVKDYRFKAEGPENSLMTSFNTILDFMEKENAIQVGLIDTYKIIFTPIFRELIKDAINKLMKDFEMNGYRKKRSKNENGMIKFVEDLTSEMSLLARKFIDANDKNPLETAGKATLSRAEGDEALSYIRKGFVRITEVPGKSVMAQIYARVFLISDLSYHIRHDLFGCRSPQSTFKDLICFIIYSFLSYEKVDSFLDKADQMKNSSEELAIGN